MIARIVNWSARHPRTVILAAVLVAAAGEMGRRALPPDVLPDLSEPRIVVLADWMGHPATEVARAVTRVLTGALDGVPRATAVRGSSMGGMAYVDVTFEAAADLAAGRRALLERVAGVTAALPPSVRVQVGPEASSTGWVFQYAITDPTHGQPPRTLRALQDDVVRPALSAIPGVVEVASVGGVTDDVLVEVRAASLRERGLAFTDVVAAVRSALGGRRAASMEELRAIPVPVPVPVPAASPGAQAGSLRVADVARVRVNESMPAGLADFGGMMRVVGGIVIAKRDANLTAVIGRARQVLEQLRARLPAGVEIVTVYDRLDLASRVGHTLMWALAEEIAVVVLVVLLFLLHVRSALVPLATLPFVLLLTFAGMWLLGVPGTLMSLGGIGIALGMAVDADVVALEACHRRIEALDAEAGASARDRRADALIAAAGTFTPAVVTSLLITALTFLPVLGFTGETGRLLRPLALTKTLVILAAAVAALTLAPALRDRLIGRHVRREFDNPLTRGLVRVYTPFVRFALDRPVLTLVTAALAIISCVPLLTRLGGEFLPRVDEGDVLFMPTTRSGIDPHLAEVDLRAQDRALRRFGEVAAVFGKVGRADTATDRAPVSMVETTIRLLPRSQWPKIARQRWYSGWAPGPLRRVLGLVWPEETAATTAELVENMDRATRLPGWTSAWTAPIRARMDMISTGVATPVAIRIVAGDPTRLDALGSALRQVVAGVPGTRSAIFESLGGETRMELDIDPAALSRHGVDAGLVRATADLLIAGGQIGEMATTSGGRPQRLLITQEQNLRGPADELRDVTVRSSGSASAPSRPVPLALLGRVARMPRPAMVRVERGELVAYVHIDLEGSTDVARYVERARQEVARALAAGQPSLSGGGGERLEWTGQYQLLETGKRRLVWIVPCVVLLMIGLLYLLFASIVEALIVLMSVPFAVVGSLWALFLLGYPLSAPVWVGLLSVTGLAMQTGVVMVVYIDAAFHRRVRDGRLTSRDDIVAAHAEGTVRRLRPKIMTITTMAAGLLPLLWAQGAGSEIMRRVAAPMIGGLASSAFLTLEVLPVLYTIWRNGQLRRAQRAGRPIAEIVGRVPPWARW